MKPSVRLLPGWPEARTPHAPECPVRLENVEALATWLRQHGIVLADIIVKAGVVQLPRDVALLEEKQEREQALFGGLKWAAYTRHQ